MKKFSKIIVLITLSFLSLKSYSQVGASYYIDDILSVNAKVFNLGKGDISAEVKIFTKREYMYSELDVLYRFAASKYHQLGIGLGLKLGLDIEDDSYLLPIVLEVYPFEKFKRASFLLELTPGMTSEDEEYSIRGLIGIRYTFGKHNRGRDE